MARSLRTYAFIACALLSSVVGASAQQSQETRTGATFPNVTIPNTELRTLNSSQTGRDDDIYVNLPGGYTPKTGKKLPVVYALDGQWEFKLLASVYGGLFYDKFVPE